MSRLNQLDNSDSKHVSISSSVVVAPAVESPKPTVLVNGVFNCEYLQQQQDGELWD